MATSARTAVKAIQDIMRKDVGVDGDAQRLSQLCWLFFLKIIDDQDEALEATEDDYRSPLPEHLQWRSWARDPEGITGEALLEFMYAFRGWDDRSVNPPLGCIARRDQITEPMVCSCDLSCSAIRQ